MHNSVRDRLHIMTQPRAVSPEKDLNTYSEDGSEFSSGVLVCDLSNEFRRCFSYCIMYLFHGHTFHRRLALLFHFSPLSSVPSKIM